MLRVSNLTKIYKTKGGIDVKALDDVSVSFPETGMVFLLGKSGSGKSTLLNVCGGLDVPTEGEIIVKGRSSNDFTQSDFDSYRNTFVGFIFQEYNILNEFSVEDNIALALELQGKPKDKERVNKLLEEVDLIGYANRKPNTLSGGQKQRIAIARALIKEPEIIMADEPTGALDSATGKQVFDTLKKLSKKKLVIVVSHDRDFAEQYGDRIIELKDGKILSDVTKTQEQQRALSENITAVGQTLCIKQGAALSDGDFEQIKAYLKKADTDVVIATGEKDVKTFKAAARITDGNEKEVFKDTDGEALKKRTYTPEESKFIRSKLPLRHAMKIGVSGLKVKPFRLFFTVLLCTMAFILFGLLSTMTFYNSEDALFRTLKSSDYSIMRIEKKYRYQDKSYQDGELNYEYTGTYDGRFSPKEIEEYKETYGDVIGSVFAWSSFGTQSKSKYWSSDVAYFSYLPETSDLRSKIIGDYPANDQEICISSFHADTILNLKIADAESGETIEMTERTDVLEKILTISGKQYKVVGILPTEELPSKYEELKDSTAVENRALEDEWYDELREGLHLACFVTENQIASQYTSPNGLRLFDYHYIAVSTEQDENGSFIWTEDVPSNGVYGKFSRSPYSVTWLGETQTLTDGQTVVSARSLCTLVDADLAKKQETATGTEKDEIAALRTKIDKIKNHGSWETNESGESHWVSLSEEERGEYLSEVITYIQAQDTLPKIETKLFDSFTTETYGDAVSFTVVGFFDNASSWREWELLFTDAVFEPLWTEQKAELSYYSETLTNYIEKEGSIYNTVFLPYDRSDSVTEEFIDIYHTEDFDENDVRIELKCSLISNFESIDSLITSLSKAFLYAGLIMALFAALLLSNFISVSISRKKKDIGILRAVGARSFDVFKIFFSESFVITAICVLLSTVGSAVLSAVLNAEVIASIGVSLFSFGVLSVAVLLGVAAVTVVLATFLPVYHAAKKKPVESIRAL